MVCVRCIVPFDEDAPDIQRFSASRGCLKVSTYLIVRSRQKWDILRRRWFWWGMLELLCAEEFHHCGREQ